MSRSTHTFVVLGLSHAAFDEISRKLKDAGYHHAFGESDGREVIDMQGIAVACDPAPPLPGTSAQMPETRKDAAYLFYRYGNVGVDIDILLSVKPLPVELANAQAHMRGEGVPDAVVERAAELIGSLR
jgi:hypothetical protein